MKPLRTGDSHLRGPEVTTWLARLAPEQDNLRAAMQWTFDERRYTDAKWLQIACGWFWFLRGQWFEEGQWLAQLLPHRHELPADLHLFTLINVYAFGCAVEEFQPLNHWKAEMLTVIAVCSNQHLHSAAWHFIACYAADFAEATTAWEKSIAAARAAREGPALGPEFCLLTDCDFLLGNHLWAYAQGLIEHGKFAEAMPLLIESRAIFQQRESRYEMADSSGTLGLRSGASTLALARSRDHCDSVQLSRNDWPLATDLGIVTLYRGEPAEARRLLNESLRLCLELKDKFFLARIYVYLTETALAAGSLAEAEQSFTQSLAYQVDQSQNLLYEIAHLFVAARMATAQQQYQRAAMLFGLAERMHSQIHYVIGGPIRALADAALATVQAALDPAVFAEAFAAGQEMSLAERLPRFWSYHRTSLCRAGSTRPCSNHARQSGVSTCAAFFSCSLSSAESTSHQRPSVPLKKKVFPPSF